MHRRPNEAPPVVVLVACEELDGCEGPDPARARAASAAAADDSCTTSCAGAAPSPTPVGHPGITSSPEGGAPPALHRVQGRVRAGPAMLPLAAVLSAGWGDSARAVGAALGDARSALGQGTREQLLQLEQYAGHDVIEVKPLQLLLSVPLAAAGGLGGAAAMVEVTLAALPAVAVAAWRRAAARCETTCCPGRCCRHADVEQPFTPAAAADADACGAASSYAAPLPAAADHAGTRPPGHPIGNGACCSRASVAVCGLGGVPEEEEEQEEEGGSESTASEAAVERAAMDSAASLVGPYVARSSSSSSRAPCASSGDAVAHLAGAIADGSQRRKGAGTAPAAACEGVRHPDDSALQQQRGRGPASSIAPPLVGCGGARRCMCRVLCAPLLVLLPAAGFLACLLAAPVWAITGAWLVAAEAYAAPAYAEMLQRALQPTRSALKDLRAELRKMAAAS